MLRTSGPLWIYWVSFEFHIQTCKQKQYVPEKEERKQKSSNHPSKTSGAKYAQKCIIKVYVYRSVFTAPPTALNLTIQNGGHSTSV